MFFPSTTIFAPLSTTTAPSAAFLISRSSPAVKMHPLAPFTTICAASKTRLLADSRPSSTTIPPFTVIAGPFTPFGSPTSMKLASPARFVAFRSVRLLHSRISAGFGRGEITLVARSNAS